MEARAADAARASARQGLEASRALTDALDAALTELAAPVARPGVAVVALGSYGRHEQCRHSDLDVMLLVRGDTADAVNAVLYPLWDSGMKVGHSVRSVEQAVEAARQNIETLTSLLDARLVSGDADLFARFVEARNRLVKRRLGWLRQELQAQRARLVAAEPWQLQEPDLKTGRGGLRDLDAVRWLQHARALAEGEARPPLAAALASALEQLVRVRHALHALEERPNDRFRRDLVPAIGDILELDRTEVGRRVFAAMRAIDTAATAECADSAPPPARAWRLPWRRPRGDDAPPDRRSDLDTLLEVVRTAAPDALEPLPDAPWLDRILPEWDVLRCLPHVAPFHLHPVDVHVWRTVAEAAAAAVEDSEDTGTIEAAAELGSHDELLLAALLHDIGKGHEGDHSRVGAVITERFASRAGLPPEAARRLVAAVEHHLLLPIVATRRDISDDRVIRETAAAAGDARTLHLLYVLSVADARASGPDVWSAWKAQLLRTLYLRVLAVLSEGVPEEATATARRRAAVLEALGGRFGADAVARHLEGLPPGYLLSTPPETIGEHLALIERAAGGTAVHVDHVGSVDRVTIVTPDRPGILSLIAGTLAVHNVSVLGGTAYTRADGVAIEVLHVVDALGHGVDERRWARVSEAVPRALAGEFPVDERLAETRAAYRAQPPAPIPTTVHVDNRGSERYSIVEVGAADRLGLLYAITRALHDLSLDIHLAKVDTLGREVVDAFYVLRENGRRVEAPDEVERLERRVVEAVAALDRMGT